jgi:antirestriction protein ArdC
MPGVIRIGGQHTKKLVQDALDKLEAALREGKSETLTAYLRTMSRFARYSLGNILLIASQRPDATRVAGFRKWKELGRHVRRGERGIAILAPMVRRRVPDPVAPQERPKQSGAPETQGATNETVMGFKTAHVFDISQTEGPPLPELVRVQGDPREHLVRLRCFAEHQGIRVEYANNLGGADGVSQGGRVRIRSGLPPAEEFSTLAHELGHELLHRDDQRRSRRVEETEAEAVAFVVCEAIGLDSERASSDYVQLHNGKVETLLASLRRVRDAALPIIESLGVAATAVTGGH